MKKTWNPFLFILLFATLHFHCVAGHCNESEVNDWIVGIDVKQVIEKKYPTFVLVDEKPGLLHIKFGYSAGFDNSDKTQSFWIRISVFDDNTHALSAFADDIDSRSWFPPSEPCSFSDACFIWTTQDNYDEPEKTFHSVFYVYKNTVVYCTVSESLGDIGIIAQWLNDELMRTATTEDEFRKLMDKKAKNRKITVKADFKKNKTVRISLDKVEGANFFPNYPKGYYGSEGYDDGAVFIDFYPKDKTTDKVVRFTITEITRDNYIHEIPVEVVIKE